MRKIIYVVLTSLILFTSCGKEKEIVPGENPDKIIDENPDKDPDKNPDKDPNEALFGEWKLTDVSTKNGTFYVLVRPKTVPLDMPVTGGLEVTGEAYDMTILVKKDAISSKGSFEAKIELKIGGPLPGGAQLPKIPNRKIEAFPIPAKSLTLKDGKFVVNDLLKSGISIESQDKDKVVFKVPMAKDFSDIVDKMKGDNELYTIKEAKIEGFILFELTR